LKRGSLYRSDVEEAVRIFRPVLQSLKIRNENGRELNLSGIQGPPLYMTHPYYGYNLLQEVIYYG
jgi:hypothetical protein